MISSPLAISHRFSSVANIVSIDPMSWSSCPFCSQQVLSTELERHANNHFEDEDEKLARDVQLAIHYQDEEDSAFDLAVVSSSHVLEVDIPMQPKFDSVRTPESVSCARSEATTTHSDGKIPCEGTKLGFMGLLKNCLECDGGNKSTTSILCGYVDHFQSVEFEDVGWGCGWRNIQMLSSHLLVQRPEAREFLFDGGGFVPDILSLQRWLEVAWEKGFDIAGSNDFDKKIYGKRTWIGTTECAALFRSFGFRARIVDFSSSRLSGDKRKSSQVTGPMDRYLNNTAAASSSNGNKDKDKNKNLGISPQMVKGHQLLANWVWSYFSDNNMATKAACNQVVVTEKSPLYFQHDGHSRTIVGIQLKRLPDGTQQHNLLIFDPGHKTKVLESCLSKKVGCQRYIKRGVHTLKKLDYQLCYMDPGIATGAEMEKLKTLDSTRFEFIN